MFVKVLLQDHGGCLGIDPLASPLRQHCRREALVNEDRFQAKAAMQLVGEASASYRHLVFRAISITGQADHADGRLPVLDQLGDLPELAGVGRFVDDQQGLRLAYAGIANCHTNTFQAEVKGKTGFQLPHPARRTGPTQ